MTRIFEPNDFGLVALYFSIISVLVIISTGRYEHSIILPVDDNDSYSILISSVILNFSFSLILFLVLLFFQDVIINFLDKPEISSWILYIPIFIILNGLFFIFRSWLIRKKYFKRVSFAAALKSLVLSLILILGGIIFDNIMVFLFANLIAQFIETTYIFKKIKKRKFNHYTAKKLLRKYINFPKFSLPSDLVSTYASHNPIFLLSYYFGDFVVGQFSLCQRVLAIPIKLISSATLEVYKQKATSDYNEFGNCLNIFLSTFKTLFLAAFIPSFIMFFLVSKFFSFFFGGDWVVAGVIAKYLIPMFFFQFSISPLSYTIYIAEKQKYNMYWQIFLLVFTTIGILLGVFYNSYYMSILGYSIAYSLMYLIYFYMNYKCAKGDFKLSLK